MFEDPFLNFYNVVARLKDEYEKHNNLVIAFDFDNTIYDYHNKGHKYTQVILLLRKASDIGLTMVCYTGNDDIELIKDYCAKNKIRLDYINESPISAPSKQHKPYFSILLDDRAGLEAAYYALKFIISEIEQLKDIQKE